MMNQQFDTTIQETMKIFTDDETSLQLKGKRTCLVSRSFQEALASHRYLQFGLKFAQIRQQFQKSRPQDEMSKEENTFPTDLESKEDHFLSDLQEIENMINEINYNKETMNELESKNVENERYQQVEIVENQNRVPSTPRNFKLQTFTSYILAKGLQGVESFFASDVIEIVKNKAPNCVHVNSYKQKIQSGIDTTTDLIHSQQERLKDFTSGSQREVYRERLKHAINHGTTKEIHKVESKYRNQLTTIQTIIHNLEICKKTLQSYLEKLSLNNRSLKLQFSKPYMHAQEVNRLKELQSINKEKKPHETTTYEGDIYTSLNQAIKNCEGDEMAYKQLRSFIDSIAHMGVEDNRLETVKQK